MFQHQLEQQNKSIAKRISDALAILVPRKATVVRPDRNGVWVRFATENASSPESWFVSTVSGAPAGTSGWVIALGGGKGLFVATNVVVPIPFAGHSGASYLDVRSTTSLTYVDIAAGSVTVPPGTYKVYATAVIPIRRSVASGEVHAYMNVGGAEAGFGVATALHMAANTWVTFGSRINGATITTTGTVDLKFRIRGAVTAGTTEIFQASITGTLIRIS